MKCFVVFGFCISILVSANVDDNAGSMASLSRRSHIIQPRGRTTKQNLPSSPARSLSPPPGNSSPRPRTSNNPPSGKSKSPRPILEGGDETPSERASKSPKISTNESRPPSSRDNTVSSPAARVPPRPVSQPTGNRPSSAMGANLPSPPQHIRTNPASRSQRGRPENIQPNSESSQAQRRRQGSIQPNAPTFQAQPSLLEDLTRARLLQLHSDPRTAKAGVEIKNAQGSLMTSRLPDRGPSALTVDHIRGSRSRLVVSPYHTSVMATNNLATGTVGAQAVGNAMVKASIDSLDAHGRGELRAQVPGRAEVKATLRGIGNVQLEAANHNPNAGHAKIQADFTGYGWVEAHGSQDRLRPDAFVPNRSVPRQPPNPGSSAQGPQQQDARIPPAQGVQQDSRASGSNPTEQPQLRRSSRRAGQVSSTSR